MRETRGEFRPIYNALWDDPAFLELTPKARLILLAVKASLPNWGIGLNRAWQANLAMMTGLRPADIDTGLARLEELRWIVRDGNVLWLRNGLRFEPTSNPRDPKHRKALQTHLAGLPRLAIVEAFRDHYPQWMEEANTAGQGRPPQPEKKGSEKSPKKGPKKDSKKTPEKSRGEGRGGEGIEATSGKISATQPSDTGGAAFAATPAPSTNWVTRLAEIHLEHAGGALQPARLGKALGPLIAKHGTERVLAVWEAACKRAKADGKLARLRYFAEDFGEWEELAFEPAIVDDEGNLTDYGRRIEAETRKYIRESA